ncbi:superoxide dismutase family protein [Actinoplanes sp. N902-109]|uniref:superoxide dismutase family protein n=1 Tax=Actinoplanes sp. (strain N902-109) TaxID=649831 RepID=UPI000A06EED2|nr:superoxide dismutase family protein [Actinoplanes sp. N902-109]
MHRLLPVLALLVPTLAGCTSAGIKEPATTPQLPPSSTPWVVFSRSGDIGASSSAAPSPAAQAPLTEGTASGTFQPYPQGTQAITYDKKVVPPGATAQVTVATNPQGVRVRLAVTGMVARRAYGAHLHTKPCTSVPDDAGPHFQHQMDPSSPSVDPAYANADNEVWLDFTTDSRGAATVASTHPWTFDSGQVPRALVIHAQLTRTEAGKAGTAGPRVACLTLRP